MAANQKVAEAVSGAMQSAAAAAGTTTEDTQKIIIVVQTGVSMGVDAVVALIESEHRTVRSELTKVQDAYQQLNDTLVTIQKSVLDNGAIVKGLAGDSATNTAVIKKLTEDVGALQKAKSSTEDMPANDKSETTKDEMRTKDEGDDEGGVLKTKSVKTVRRPLTSKQMQQREEGMEALIKKLEKKALVEKRSFNGTSKFDGAPDKFMVWRSPTRKFLTREPWLRALLDAVEATALTRENKKSQIRELQFEVLDPITQRALPVTADSWEDEDELWCQLLRTLSENFFQVLQALLESSAGIALDNLENSGPSRGLEVWAKLHRDYYGEQGPRVLSLCLEIFQPEKVKFEGVTGACISHESAIRRLEEHDQATTYAAMKLFGLLGALPDELRSDAVKNFEQFGYDYAKAQRWILDQVALRRKEAGKRGLQALGHEGGGEDEPEIEYEDFQKLPLELQEQKFNELMAFRGKGKAGGKGGSSPFAGNCGHCGKYGHRMRDCRILDKVMSDYRAGKGNGKTSPRISSPQGYPPGGKAKGGWQGGPKGGWKGGFKGGAPGKGFPPSGPPGINELTQVMNGMYQMELQERAPAGNTYDNGQAWQGMPWYLKSLRPAPIQLKNQFGTFQDDDEEVEEFEEFEPIRAE